MTYIDTSALCDFYVKGVRTRRVADFIRQHQGRVAISAWVDAEFYSALGRRVRGGELPERLANEAVARYRVHKLGQLFRVYAVEARHFKNAASKTAQFRLALKAPDALHVALAEEEGCSLLTADKGMADAARAFGVPTIFVSAAGESDL